MGRQPCCDKVGLKRGPWTIEEDHKLMNFILTNGIQCWRLVPKLAGLLRCGKSCRLRWINYLRPDLKRGLLTESEEDLIIQLHARLGNRWSKIASHFPGRTDNEIKNHWNTRIKKRLKQLGVDPNTHKPIEQDEENKDKCIEPSVDDGKEQKDIFETGAKFADKNIGTDILKKDETKASLVSETNDVLNPYEMLCEGLDLDLWMNEEQNYKTMNNSSESPSFSLDSSINPNSSMGENSSIQQWVDHSVDSLSSWDCFNLLGDDQFFLFP